MNNTTSPTGQIVMLVALFAIMYFLLIRPQKKQEKQVREMRSALKVGDDIVTIGGICGKIVRVKDNRLTIQVGADKTKFDIEKWAVSRLDEGRKETASKTSKTEEEKKVTPKSMKKLGKKEDGAEEAVAETAADAE
ncbi:MAG: preprotein translocase subunit YajC [Firmicutes bacterium]|nr:preprotein translocase subunit YajC [Bacillota bacterium]